MIDLDKQLTDFYRSKSLSSNRIELIQAHSKSMQNRRWLPVYVAAAALIVILAGVMHHTAVQGERTDQALREAAMNHLTKLKLDYETSDLQVLMSSMTELPFTLKLPEKLRDAVRLTGARYCTVRGNLAAHLKFTDPESKEQFSLFMTNYHGTLAKLPGESGTIEDVNVTLWREDGLFYALAKARQIL